MEFANFHHAYSHVVRDLVNDPEYHYSRDGFPVAERIGVRFRVADASQRIPVVPTRRLDIAACFAEALRCLSDHEDHLRAVADQLRDNPDSARADVPGSLGLCFMIREAALHCVAFVEADDVYQGMAHGVFTFTFLQELLARELGVAVGSYTHSVGSTHLSDSDRERATAMLADPSFWDADAPRFPSMPDGDNWPYVRAAFAQQAAPGLPEYWAQVAVLFELDGTLRRGEPVGDELVARLSPLYRWLVQHRLPSTILVGS